MGGSWEKKCKRSELVLCSVCLYTNRVKIGECEGRLKQIQNQGKGNRGEDSMGNVWEYVRVCVCVRVCVWCVGF